jgi:GMP synthase-like glutamine amidotransferase
MLPIAIFRFSPSDGPAHFGDWLDAKGLAWQLIALDAGAQVPADARAFAGIGMMGGPMSLNDGLPWVAPMTALLRDAVAARVPVLGHCLGGQLLAQALGARVSRAPVAEIGWLGVEVCAADARAEWFGGRAAFTAFQWHYDAFSLPEGATRVLTNRFNANQAFVIDGCHVGFQCHVEMTRELTESWVASGGDELPATSSASLQNAADIRRDLDARVAALNAVADAIYARWARALVR